ncbi:MAG: MarR family winged helix-turn-helix transcriptional regulator [Acidimicrobiales bacterium]
MLPDPDRLAAWRAFLTAHAAMEKMLSRELMQEFDLQLPWFEVLDALSANEGAMRFNELAERTMTHPSSLSRQLDKMEERHFVAREKATGDDGRAVEIVLTPRGHDMWRAANPAYYRIVRRVFTNSLTETDLHALERIFGKVLEAD